MLLESLDLFLDFAGYSFEGNEKIRSSLASWGALLIWNDFSFFSKSWCSTVLPDFVAYFEGIVCSY